MNNTARAHLIASIARLAPLSPLKPHARLATNRTPMTNRTAQTRPSCARRRRINLSLKQTTSRGVSPRRLNRLLRPSAFHRPHSTQFCQRHLRIPSESRSGMSLSCQLTAHHLPSPGTARWTMTMRLRLSAAREAAMPSPQRTHLR
jgi:hypothetical protein